MCIRNFVTSLACACLLACFASAAGCRVLDGLARDVNKAGSAARDRAADPNNALPPEARTILELGGLACWAASTLYQRIRHGELQKTAKVIVRGVERTPKKQAGPVLANIKDAMLQAGNYERRNALVDKLKGTA